MVTALIKAVAMEMLWQCEHRQQFGNVIRFIAIATTDRLVSCYIMLL